MRTLISTLLLLLRFSAHGQVNTEPHFSNISMDSLGDIQWTVTFHQNNSFSIQIEKQVNRNWTNTGAGLGGISLEAKDLTAMKTITSTSRVKFNKGLNIYRLVMTFPDKIVSEDIRFTSNISNDDGSLWIINNTIILDDTVPYEILNSIGATIQKGQNKLIDISGLTNGNYFLYTKTWTKEFVK